MDEGGRERLAKAIERRRNELRLSVRQAAVLAGIDRGTWASAENGSRLTAKYNYAGIEMALDWKPGSIEAILAGGEPTPEEGEIVGNRRVSTATIDDIAAEIERISRLNLSATAKLRLMKPLNDLLEQATAEQQRSAS